MWHSLCKALKKEANPYMECGKASYSRYIIEHQRIVLKSEKAMQKKVVKAKFCANIK